MCYRATNKHAREEYPDDLLRVAVIGTIEKSDETFRTIHDGTHGVHVSNQARMRDLIRMPGPKEGKDQAHTPEARPLFFWLQADQRGAHEALYRRCD